MYQDIINTIINNNTLPKQEKILSINKFLSSNDCDYLVDFDDTITDKSCLLYSKYNYLAKHKKKHIENIVKDFKLNKDFKRICKELKISNIFIVTSNNIKFLETVIEQNKLIIEKELWINILGIIWSTENFHIHPNDKLIIIPKSKKYISDIMEYNKQKWNKNFICVEKYSFKKLILTYLKKLFYYGKFILKNV